MIGYLADLDPGANPEISPVENATAIGANAFVSQSNSLVLGSIAGENEASASVNVGVGTTSPATRFHVAGDSPGQIFSVTSAGKVGVGTLSPANGVHVKNDAPGFIFEESDWGNQKWQMAALNGEWRIRDLSAGNVYPFRVAPGIGGTAFMIASSGNVGIGTDTPAYDLEVVGSIYASGAIIPGSSRDLKEQIEDLEIEEAMETFHQLNPVTFRYKDDGQKDLNVGFIAEDVPDLVSVPGRKGISSMDIVAILTKVLQEKDREIEKQYLEMKFLKADLVKMQQDLAEIRALISK
jgi:hypothetical protein